MSCAGQPVCTRSCTHTERGGGGGGGGVMQARVDLNLLQHIPSVSQGGR